MSPAHATRLERGKTRSGCTLGAGIKIATRLARGLYACVRRQQSLALLSSLTPKHLGAAGSAADRCNGILVAHGWHSHFEVSAADGFPNDCRQGRSVHVYALVARRVACVIVRSVIVGAACCAPGSCLQKRFHALRSQHVIRLRDKDSNGSNSRGWGRYGAGRAQQRKARDWRRTTWRNAKPLDIPQTEPGSAVLKNGNTWQGGGHASHRPPLRPTPHSTFGLPNGASDWWGDMARRGRAKCGSPHRACQRFRAWRAPPSCTAASGCPNPGLSESHPPAL